MRASSLTLRVEVTRALQPTGRVSRNVQVFSHFSPSQQRQDLITKQILHAARVSAHALQSPFHDVPRNTIKRHARVVAHLRDKVVFQERPQLPPSIAIERTVSQHDVEARHDL